MSSPAFVDHHTHVLSFAGNEHWGLPDEDETQRQYRLARDGSTPMDDTFTVRVGDLASAVRSALEHAASVGLVQVTEAGMTSWRYLDLLQDLRRDGGLPVRVRLLLASGIANQRQFERLGDDQLEIEGVKFYADGWLSLRTCAVYDGFADRPEERGLLFLDAERLARRAEPFARRGMTIATHAIGDRGIEAVLDAYAQLYGSSCAEAAPRIEHAVMLRDEQIARIAEMGVVICMQPTFSSTYAADTDAALGERRFLAYRWRALLDTGARVIAGSDHPLGSLDPAAALEALETNDGLDREEALRLLTA